MSDLDHLLGGLAGLTAAFFWAVSTTIWGMVGRSIPAHSLIVIRVTLAIGLLMLSNRFMTGSFLPAEVAAETLVLLSLSGFLAMVVGDYLFFKAVTRIGPRLLMIVFAATPIVTAGIAWMVTGETVSPRGMAGIAVIVGGIVWVVSEPNGSAAWNQDDPRQFRIGIVLATMSLLATGSAYALTRAAVGGGERLFTEGPALAPVASADAALFRLAAAGVLAWVALPFSPALRPTFATLANPRLMRFVVPGTVAGLFLGSWFSMMALARVPGGIASALLSCSPIFMIPLTRLFFGERHSARALIGTLVTIAGVFVLLV
jgi:drug/metabolite transporter (DMT)-like permease